MEKLLVKVTKLIEVKKIIALMVTIVFCVLAYKGVVTQEAFVPIVTMVMGYYFGQSTTRSTLKELK